MAAGKISRKIQSRPHSNGFAIIISNDYTGPGARNLQELNGTRHDGEKMEVCFESLNLTTYREHNVSRKGMLDMLNYTANYTHYPPSYTRIIVVFSGHGTSGQNLYTSDGKMVKVGEILQLFAPEKARFIGKFPKLFFIDACRGKLVNPGVIVPKGGKLIETLKVPQKGNFLVAYSTLPEYQSYEETHKGGIWMSTLAEKLKTNDKSVCDILAEVNKELVRKYQGINYGECVQQPELVSTLNEVVNLCAEARGTRAKASGPSSKEGEVDEELAKLFDESLSTNHLKPKVTSYEGIIKSLKGKSCSSMEESPPLVEHKPPTRSKSLSSPRKRNPILPISATASLPPSTLHSGIGGNAKQRLCHYCEEKGKPKPQFNTEKLPNGNFVSIVYVAKAFGRIKGDEMSSKCDAEMNAAAKYIEKLE